jgi:hypothetical protein
MDVAKIRKKPISFNICHPHVLLILQKLNQCLSKHNYGLFQPISDHPLVHNWSLKHSEEEVYIIKVHKTQLQLLNIVKVIHKNNMCGQRLHHNCYKYCSCVLLPLTFQSDSLTGDDEMTTLERQRK